MPDSQYAGKLRCANCGRWRPEQEMKPPKRKPNDPWQCEECRA